MKVHSGPSLYRRHFTAVTLLPYLSSVSERHFSLKCWEFLRFTHKLKYKSFLATFSNQKRTPTPLRYLRDHQRCPNWLGADNGGWHWGKKETFIRVRRRGFTPLWVWHSLLKARIGCYKVREFVLWCCWHSSWKITKVLGSWHKGRGRVYSPLPDKSVRRSLSVYAQGMSVRSAGMCCQSESGDCLV